MIKISAYGDLSCFAVYDHSNFEAILARLSPDSMFHLKIMCGAMSERKQIYADEHSAHILVIFFPTNY